MRRVPDMMPKVGADPLQTQAFPVGPGAWLVRVQGAVDGSNVRLLEGTFNCIFDRGVFRIGIDLEETTYLSSAGFGCIIAALGRARRNQGLLVIARAPLAIREIFTLLGIEDELEFAGDFNDTLARLVGLR